MNYMNMKTAYKIITILLMMFGMLHAKVTMAATTVAVPPTNGLQLYYDFESGDTNSSVVLDKSGHGNTGTQTNFLGLTAGKIGQAIQFDGANRGVVASNVASLQLNTFTASVWVKTGGAGSGYRAIFDKPNSWGMFFGGACATNVFLIYDWGGGGSQCSSSGAVTDNLWHNYTCTFQSGVVNGTKCYMDGTLILTTSYTSLDQGTGVSVGVNSNQQFPVASIDEARIYNRILSAQEIQALANAKAVATTNKANNLGLVGWWTFDVNKMTNATATDSISGNGASLVNMTFANSSLAGKFGQALSFSGTKYVSLPNSSAFNLTSAYTISAWVYPRSFSNYQNVIYKDGGGGASGQYGIIVFADGHWEAEGLISGSPGGVTGGTLSLNKWQHVTVTLTGSTLKTYLNGTLVSTNNSASNNSNGTAATIGSDIVHNRPFDGNIDDVRIYNRALSDAEIRVLAVSPGPAVVGSYSNPNAGTNGGLVGWWTFDGKNMTNATATESALGNNATLVAMTMANSAVMGKLGQALSFNGSSKYMTSTAPTSLNSPSAITVSAWIILNESPAVQKAAVSHMMSSNPFSGFELGVDVGNKAYFHAGGTYVANELASSATLTQGKWYHLVGVYDGTRSYLYINGALDTSAIRTNNLGVSSEPIDIGTNYDRGRFFNGKIDDLRIYNRALSATEIYNLYKMGGK
jgi:hypothetical protein